MISPDQDLHPAHVKQTHAVDILAFVEAQEIPSLYFETPYYLAPAPGGEKDYALLRETLRRTKKIGIAYVVIDARQHLAVLVPQGQSLVLNTLRWSNDPLAGFGIDDEDDDFSDEWAEIELSELTEPEQPVWGQDVGNWNGALCHDGFQRVSQGFSSQAVSDRRETEVVIETLDDIFDDDFDSEDDLLDEFFSGKTCRASATGYRQRQTRRARHLRSRVRSRRPATM